MDNSILLSKQALYYLIDLQACYNRQLLEMSGMLEEFVGRERKEIKLITKVIINQNHYVSTSFRVSIIHYGGENNHLTGTRQGNRFLGDVCQDISYMIMEQIENKKLRMHFALRITLKSDQIAVALFADDTDIITEGKDVKMKMQEILKIHKNLYLVTGGHIEEKKCKYFTWRYRYK